MPFDSSPAFTIPAVETDEVLRELVAARNLLTDARRWAKGDYCAGDAFCVYGALHHVSGRASDEIGKTERSKTAAFLEAVARNRSLHIWNDLDTTTHADVLALFDRAIAARRAAVASTPA
jgi:hypothetical protein